MTTNGYEAGNDKAYNIDKLAIFWFFLWFGQDSFNFLSKMFYLIPRLIVDAFGIHTLSKYKERNETTVMNDKYFCSILFSSNLQNLFLSTN